MSKNRIAALGASAASAALVGTALFAPAAVAQEPEPSPSAYAISADGLITIAKTPHATGTQDPEPVLSIPGEPLVTVEALDSASAPGEASSSVAGLTVAQLPSGIPGLGGAEHLIEADLIEASCTEGNVTSNIAELRIAGNTIPVDTNPDTGIPAPLDEIIDITLNQQIDNPDGSTTVNAVSISILEGADSIIGDAPILGQLAGQTITLASATCGPTDGGETTPPTTPPEDGDNGNGDDGNGDNGNGDNGNGDDGQDGDEADEDGTAPTPTPQPDHIAVTG